MDDEILKTVESLLGKDIKIVDCEKTSSVREEEILLINGIPVQIEGEDGIAIKSALMTGQVPPCDLLNQLLFRAGILQQPVHLETSLSVKSSVIRKEEVTVARHGKILNERTSETQENNIYTSSCKEIWEPVNKLGALKTIIPIPVDRCLLNGEGNECGDAFLLAAPKQFSPSSSTTRQPSLRAEPPSKELKSESQQPISNSTSNVIRDLSKASPVVPSTSAASSLSLSSTSLSFHNNPSRNDNPDKSFSYTDCCSISSPLKTPLSPTILKPADVKSGKLDNPKKILNCMSFDSGHDDFFNSFSQSNFLSAVTGTCGSCSGVEDDTHGTGTPTLHSNSISSCYDFISSSDEGDQQCSPPSMMPSASGSILQELPSRMPTIFGTVASDQSPKDSINRKGFPQTTTTNCSGKSIDKIQNQLSSKHPNTTATISSSPNVAQSNQQHSVDNEDNALVYRDGNLISGPLDTLIQHMVPTSDYYPDRSYLFAFLLSARLFIRPHELLAKICQLCDEQQDLSCSCCCSCSTSEHRAEDTVDHAYQKPQNNQLILEHHHHQHHHCYHPPCDEGGGADAKPGTDCCSFDIAELDCCRRLRTFAQHFVRLLAEWIDTFPYDFRDERLMQHVRSMTRKCISIDNSLRKDVQTMLQDLLQRLTVLEKYEEFLLTLSQTIGSTDGPNNIADLQSQESVKSHTSTVTHSKPSVLTIQNNLHGTAGESSSPPTGGVLSGGGVQQQQQQQLATSSSASSTSSILSSGGGGLNPAASIDISQLCPSPTLIAHQLTHIELERLSHIGPEEFVQAFAKENPHLEQSFSDMKKTRNLESYVQWFNRLSYLVATEIVKHPKKKQRVRIVEYWIEIARECFNIGNFNSLMAIIAGLNMSPISRLKKTWSKVQSAKFLVLEHQMDPSSNFNSYRSTLKAAMWRSAGATDERERIVIPFFSLLVKDLYFLNEGCSNKLANGHINFEKFWQLAKQVTEFIAWKQVTCPFEKLPKVIMFLQTSNILNENKLAIASFECEPPDNNHEKDRFKSLKSEQQNLQQHSHQ
ncbi:unnamed protein product [Hermetia illucens]|uniref:Ras-GEF domain-containing family member 1B n=1 Tax=Hermetia illucens TaxID=343691 RepID=A0A7R8V7C4_HERIL|nr:unnamed protein product [Hermetia illucens]